MLLGLALLATAGCLGVNRSSAGPGTSSGNDLPRVGNPAPDFALKSLDGETVRLSELRGRPVFINFWASWCPPCKQEMPDIEKAYQRYRDEGFVFLGVDVKEDAGTVRDYVASNGYSWTFLLDPDGQAVDAFLVNGIPASFFIDRDGIIRDLQTGAMTAGTLEAKLGKIR